MTVARFTVDATIHAQVAELPPELVDAVTAALTVPNPEHAKRLRLDLWLGATDPELEFWSTVDGELHLPRGGFFHLRHCAGDLGIDLETVDRRVLPAERLPEMPAVPLRKYQVRAVAELERVTQGIVTLPCGAGKTRTAIGAIARLRTPALVLVHTIDLFEQWRGELRGLLGLEPGIIGAGEASIEPVTVALVQSLSRWEPPALAALLARFGLLVIDEAHHVAASTFSAIVNAAPSQYRLGLSATPYREDGLTVALELYLGRELAPVSHRELIAAGVLVAPRFETVETAFEYDYVDAADYVPMVGALVQNPARNLLVIRRVVADARAGHTVLVLTGRVAHCTALAGAIRDRGITAAVLTGKTSKRKRAETLERVRAGDVRVLVSTQLADEGLDLPRLSRVHLVCPGRAHGRTVQRIGRLMRPCPGKLAPAVVDYVDHRVGLLSHQHRARRLAFLDVLGSGRQ